MEIILLKIILCSGILLGLYHLFLAKEKTFIFNRFYLISALVFSLCIPFATIETEQMKEEIPETVFVGEMEQPTLQTSTIQQERFNYNKILIISYFIITGILLLKFAYSILKIKKLKGRNLIYQHRKIMLLEKDLAPFSFWNTIYLSENYFENSKIDDAIFLHEEIHIKQKHSADILFVEIVKAVLWFNPFVYFYKKAMINNHEFIADESVIAQNNNLKNYQELILQEILKQQNLHLIHQFNFNNTKKRFIMMTRKNSKFAKTKKYLAIPAFAVLAIIFAEKIDAKENENFIQEDRLKINDNEIQRHNSTNYNSEVGYKKDSEIISEKNTESYPSNEIAHDNLQNYLKKNEEKLIKKNDTIPIKKKAEENQENVAFGEKAELIPAEFPGGANKLRSIVAANFDGSIFKGDEGTVRTTITFIVDENGKVRDIKSLGENEKFNNEAYRTIQLATKDVTWKPATKDGEVVAYQYKIPLIMSFEPSQRRIEKE